MPNDLWGSCGGGRFLVSEVPLYCDNVDRPRQALWYSSDRFRKFGIVFGTIGRLVAQTFWKYMEIHFQNTPTKGLACLISGCSTFALFHSFPWQTTETTKSGYSLCCSVFAVQFVLAERASHTSCKVRTTPLAQFCSNTASAGVHQGLPRS